METIVFTYKIEGFMNQGTKVLIVMTRRKPDSF